MKKYLLTLFTLAVAAISATAQMAPAGTRLGHSMKAPMKHTVAARAHAAMPQILGTQTNHRALRAESQRDPKELSYNVTGNEIGYYSIGGVGYTYEEFEGYGLSGYGYAAYFGEDMVSRYVGNKITKIHFACWKGNYSNASVYILDGNGNTLASSSVANVQPMTNGSVPDNATAIDYTITGKEGGLYIGWVADVTAASDDEYAEQSIILPMYRDSTESGNGAILISKDSDGNMYIESSVSSWKENGVSKSYAAMLYAETEGNAGLNNNDAYLAFVPQIRVNKNTGLGREDAYALVTNLGRNTIESLDWTYELDGKTQSGTYVPEEPLVFYKSAYIYFEPQTADNASRGTGKFTITSVNNTTDDYTADDDNVISASAITMDHSYLRTPVVEEFTSTYCGWCPQAFKPMADAATAMESKQGIVEIAIHTNYSNGTDRMTDTSYSDFVNLYGQSLPSALCNRQYQLPGFDYLQHYAENITAQPVEVSMQLASATDAADATGKTINVTSTYTFDFDCPAGEYGVAYVLTEDGITSQRQLNYYATYYQMYKSYGYTDSQIKEGLGWDDDDMTLAKVAATADANSLYWYKPTFNNVSVSINDIDGDDPASLLPAIKAGQAVTHTATLTVPTRTTPKINNANLKVAALLIDQNSGYIVTARQAKVGETSAVSAIRTAQANDESIAQISTDEGAFTISATDANAEVYTTDGKLVSSARVNGTISLPTFGHGTYIVRVVKGSHTVTKKAVF